MIDSNSFNFVGFVVVILVMVLSTDNKTKIVVDNTKNDKLKWLRHIRECYTSYNMSLFSKNEQNVVQQFFVLYKSIMEYNELFGEKFPIPKVDSNHPCYKFKVVDKFYVS